MNAEINAQFQFSVDIDTTIPLATLGEFPTEQDIPARLLKVVVEASTSKSSRRTVAKNTHTATETNASNEPPPRPAGPLKLLVTTTSFQYVEDTAAEQEEDSYFRPVKDIIAFDSQKQYQPDSWAKSVELATSLSNLDAAGHGHGFVSMPPPTTINRRVKKYGSKLTEYLPQCVSGPDADVVVADATKCHSRDDDRSYHSVQATLCEDTADESRSLLDLLVNADWVETAADLDEIGAVTDDTPLVSDAEPGLVDAFTDEHRDHQLDLVHVGRALEYNRWDDGVFSLERRNDIVSEVIDDLFNLKNSGQKDRPKGERSGDPLPDRPNDRAAPTDRIATGPVLFGDGGEVTRRWLPSMVTFADHALDEFEVHRPRTRWNG